MSNHKAPVELVRLEKPVEQLPFLNLTESEANISSRSKPSRPLRAGQMVEIGLEEKSMLFSALLMYIVPLFTLLVATLLSSYISANELIRAILIFMLTALSFVMVKRYTHKLGQQTEFQPVLLRVLS